MFEFEWCMSLFHVDFGSFARACVCLCLCVCVCVRFVDWKWLDSCRRGR